MTQMYEGSRFYARGIKLTAIRRKKLLSAGATMKCQQTLVPKKASWFVYIVESNDGYLYAGITTDVERRLREHQGLTGKNKGAKFFRGRKAVAVMHTETYDSRSEASRRESEIKKMTVSVKRALFE